MSDNIFKYSFTKFNNVWIETTEESHLHGGKGWEFGKCLWSPSSDKSGGKIYELMLQPKVGDPVIHFYLKDNVRYLNGYSFVDKNCQVTNEEPPEAGKWAGRTQYYKIELKHYEQFERLLDLRIITKKYGNEIRAELIEDEPNNYPFNTYQEEIRLGQGRYLTRCTEKLFEIFREALNIEQTNLDEEQKSNDDPHEDYSEGKRKKRESYFFARNPQLVKKAKQIRGYICEACGFDFKKKYGELGDKYIECHHENPLSERTEKEWNENLKTSVNDVRMLCSNCHRMIHRTRPAKKFEDLLLVIKKN